MRIRHIINPVKVTEKSDLFIAQPITYASLLAAQEFALEHGVEVELAFTCYPEDLSETPAGFVDKGVMDRSMLDFSQMSKKRKLPLIHEIFQKLLKGPDVDLLVYTNVDIAVQPHFYVELQNIYNQGYDAFTINRRTLPKEYTSPSQLPLMYQDPGEKHPGHDCFVFEFETAKKYILGLGCIGANWIGRILLSNLIASAKHFYTFENKKLTFHIGDDRSWKTSEFNDYDVHNEKELVGVLKQLLQREYVNNEPQLRELFNYHRGTITSRDNIKSSTFSRSFPTDPKNFLPTAYKGSGRWDAPVLLNQTPIFVVGYPRSGTTLLQSKLMTQKNIISTPETHFFTIVRNALIVKNDRIDPKSLDATFSIIRERYPFSVEMEDHVRKVAENGELSPKMLFEMVVTDNLIGEHTIDEIRNGQILEKTPDHVVKLDVILRFYPNARIINIVRNPEKAIISRRQNFIGEDEWPIQNHALRWCTSVQAAEKYDDSRLISIRLEDFVTDEVKVMKELCDFLNISFEPCRLNLFPKMAKKVALPWEHWKSENSKSVSTDIANRSSRRLTMPELKVLQLIAGEEMDRWGYLEKIGDSKWPTDKSKSIVVFSHIPSHPQTQGNSKRIYSVCKSLKDKGYTVSFFYYLEHQGLKVDYEEMFNAWDDVCIVSRKRPAPTSENGYYKIDDPCEEELAIRFGDYCKERNAGIAFVNYVFYSCVFKNLSKNVLKIIDTHDRFTDRHLKLKNAGVEPSLWWYSFSESEEANGLSRADVVLAIQEEEAKYFSNITSTKVAVLPQLEEYQGSSQLSNVPFKTVGFIGSENPVNQQALSQLINYFENYPYAEKLPELMVAGKVCNQAFADHPKINLMGMVDSVDEFYSSIDAVIVPLEFGTGLKIKAVEALAYGKPLISTKHGSIGLNSKHHLLNIKNIHNLVAVLAGLTQPSSLTVCNNLISYCKNLFNRYRVNADISFRKIFSRSEGLENKVEDSKAEIAMELVKQSNDLIVKYAPPIKQTNKKALFIGHGYHKKTNSSQFFIDYLEQLYDFQLYWLSPHKEDKNYPSSHIGDFDIVFFWQLMPSVEVTSKLTAGSIVCIPMYDATGVYQNIEYNQKRWWPYREYSFISFCRVFHNNLKSMGIDSFYLQFAPVIRKQEVATHVSRTKPKVLFLYRKKEIDWPLVKRLFRSEDVDSIHIHVMKDPGHTFEYPDEQDTSLYNIKITEWFADKSEYEALLDSCDVFIAPRLYEGIGMAFLDAMATGLCVVGPHLPTLSEYVIHGETGILYDPEKPSYINISNFASIGNAALESIQKVRTQYSHNLKILQIYLKRSCEQRIQLPSDQEIINATIKKLDETEKKVLLVFPHNPFLASNGVQTRFLGLLDYFKSRNVSVDLLAHDNFVDKWDKNDPQINNYLRNLYLYDIGVLRTSGLAFNDKSSPLPDFAFKSLKEKVDNLVKSETYDFVIIGYVHWAKLIRGITGSETVIMVEDCISRNLLERHGGEKNYDYKSSFHDEGNRIGAFNKAIFISPQEMDEFSAYCKKTICYHIPHRINSSRVKLSNIPFDARKYDILFVGSDNPFNVEAMKWFILNVWNLISKHVTFAIVGDVGDELKKQKDIPIDERISLVGRVEDLSQYYELSKISISPMLSGTGLKIKVVEALSNGLPVVALPLGLVGLSGDFNDCCFEVKTPHEYANKIHAILESPETWGQSSRKAAEYANAQFSADAVGNSLDKVFDCPRSLVKTMGLCHSCKKKSSKGDHANCKKLSSCQVILKISP